MLRSFKGSRCACASSSCCCSTALLLPLLLCQAGQWAVGSGLGQGAALLLCSLGLECCRLCSKRQVGGNVHRQCSPLPLYKKISKKGPVWFIFHSCSPFTPHPICIGILKQSKERAKLLRSLFVIYTVSTIDPTRLPVFPFFVILFVILLYCRCACLLCAASSDLLDSRFAPTYGILLYDKERVLALFVIYHRQQPTATTRGKSEIYFFRSDSVQQSQYLIHTPISAPARGCGRSKRFSCLSPATATRPPSVAVEEGR